MRSPRRPLDSVTCCCQCHVTRAHPHFDSNHGAGLRRAHISLLATQYRRFYPIVHSSCSCSWMPFLPLHCFYHSISRISALILLSAKPRFIKSDVNFDCNRFSRLLNNHPHLVVQLKQTEALVPKVLPATCFLSNDEILVSTRLLLPSSNPSIIPIFNALFPATRSKKKEPGSSQ